MKEFMHSVYNFFVTNDFPTLLEHLRGMEWNVILRSVYTWMIIVPFMGLLIWTKSVKTIVAIVSLGLFVVLLKTSLAPAGEAMPLHDLLMFMLGTFSLAAVNLYFLFIRQ